MKTLRYALIGCGKVAVKHLKAALYQANRKNSIEIAALVDTRPGAAADLLDSCGFNDRQKAGIKIYQDYEEMLEQVRPGLTAITTPSGSHALIGVKALQSGSHILLEKPLTLSLAEADRLLETASVKGLQIAVGHIYRFFPMVQALQQDLAAGRFGRVLYGDVKVRWGHGQAYYDQADWRGTWSHDGGALMNQSIHALDLMVWLLGSTARNVSGRIDRQIHRMQAEDLGFATLQMEDGIWCQLEGTTNTSPDRQEASFFVRCEHGEIRGGIKTGRPSMEVIDQTGRDISGRYLRCFLRRQWKDGKLAALKQLVNPHSGLYADLIDAIRTGRTPIADGKSGRDAVELVLAVYQSALLQRTVELPLRDFELGQMTSFFPPQP